MIQLGLLVHQVGFLSHHKRTAPEFVFSQDETTLFRRSLKNPLNEPGIKMLSLRLLSLYCKQLWIKCLLNNYLPDKPFMAPAIDLLNQHQSSVFQSFKSRRVAVHGTEALLTRWKASEAFHVPKIGQKSWMKKERMVKVQFFLLLTFLLSNTWSVWSMGFHLPTMSSWEKKKKRQTRYSFFLCGVWNIELCHCVSCGDKRAWL